MHLEDNAGTQSFAAQALIDADHRNLDNVGCSSLNRGIHRHTLTERTLHKIAGFQLRNRSHTPIHSLDLAVFPARFYQTIEETFDIRVSFKVTLNVLGRFLAGNTEIFAQPKRADTIYDTEIDCFCIAAKLRCHFLKRHMEYLRRRDRVDVLRLSVCLDEVLVIRHMRQHTQLNLGIISVNQHTALARYKQLPDLASQLHTHRNVLQVRLCTADTSCRCDRLVKGSVDSSVLPDKCTQPVRIGRFEFRHLAIV